MTVTAPASRETPPRRGRRARPGRSGKILSAVAGIVLASAAVVVQQYVPDAKAMGSPLTYTGEMNQEVSADRFSVRVRSVSAARAIENVILEDDPKRTEARGIFLIVQVSATVPKQPTHLVARLLTAEDTVYEPTDRVAAQLTFRETWIQPGWWNSGVYVFEVPPEVIAGARIVITVPTGALVGEAFPPEAEVDLGLDEAAAADLVAKAEPVRQLGKKGSS
ncbi:hypothetical protein HNP84_008586 [Thermocatellispora tengchongensis]|uniref:DUF4352 domain-containing protein n=1 Tax=Thermocatellispora tengchongensis TaxID=1073253 RepID=A0A840PGY5_9ACTN|nr:hypothetical protein [Thermocatellispora tengchongensis]MBB5138828.1 hypothetical protein [Thermocatellispora tengchongensis]